MKKEAILISACLLGVPCRYDGASKPVGNLAELEAHYRLVPVCPEVLGGLPTPRPASEIQPDDSVRNCAGQDVTAQYRAGAARALAIAQKEGCRVAILKSKSPSCGAGMVYDGSFSGTLRSGDGITVRLLRENGIRVLGEEELSALFTGKNE